MPRSALIFALLVGCASTEDPTTSPATNDAATDATSGDTAAADTGSPADSGSSPDTADAAAADAAPADTATDTATIEDTAPDASEDTAIADTAADAETDTAPPSPVDCLSGDFGPSSYTLVDFFYELHVSDCTSSACSDFFMFDKNTCKLTLQVADVPHDAILDGTDCELFRKWLTSDLLVTKLRDTTTCYYGPKGTGPGPYESTAIKLADGDASKKTWSCPAEPFASHRACLQQLRTKYFPGL